MREIQLTRGYVALIDDDDFEKVSRYKWRVQKSNKRCNVMYATGSVDGKETLMHRFILGSPQGKQIDHANNNGLDNRRCNLRICTPADNSHNCRKWKTATTSKYKGVHFSSCRQRYRATILHKGKRYHIGYFESEEVAAHAYDKKAKELFGSFAALNFG